MAAALARYEESLALCQEVGNRYGTAGVLLGLGHLARDQGDRRRARALYADSLALRRTLGEQLGIAVCLEALAGVDGVGTTEAPWTTSSARRAAYLCGCTAALRAAITAPLSPLERAVVDRLIAAASATLGDEAFVAAWSEGQAMALEQAIALALEDQPIL